VDGSVIDEGGGSGLEREGRPSVLQIKTKTKGKRTEAAQPGILFGLRVVPTLFMNVADLAVRICVA
jgi:hypothetical protein